MPGPTNLPPELLARVAAVFHVLGDPSRLTILQTLIPGPQTVGAVVARTGKGQANVSKHLAVLAAAGLVTREPRGTQALYRVCDPLVFKLCDIVCGAVRHKMAEQAKTQQRVLSRM